MVIHTLCLICHYLYLLLQGVVFLLQPNIVGFDLQVFVLFDRILQFLQATPCLTEAALIGCYKCLKFIQFLICCCLALYTIGQALLQFLGAHQFDLDLPFQYQHALGQHSFLLLLSRQSFLQVAYNQICLEILQTVIGFLFFLMVTGQGCRRTFLIAVYFLHAIDDVLSRRRGGSLFGPVAHFHVEPADVQGFQWFFPGISGDGSAGGRFFISFAEESVTGGDGRGSHGGRVVQKVLGRQ